MINSGWKSKQTNRKKCVVKRLFRQNALFALPCQLDNTQTANVFLRAASCLRSLFACKGITQGLNKWLRMNEDHLQSVFFFFFLESVKWKQNSFQCGVALKSEFGCRVCKEEQMRMWSGRVAGRQDDEGSQNWSRTEPATHSHSATMKVNDLSFSCLWEWTCNFFCCCSVLFFLFVFFASTLITDAHSHVRWLLANREKCGTDERNKAISAVPENVRLL